MQPLDPNPAHSGARRTLALNTTRLNATTEKLATGHRINRGADDPAGLITSENLRAVLAALDAESRMLQRADHVASTAEGAMSEMSNLLVEARGLATTAANSAGISPEERNAIQMELDSIVIAIDRIAGSSTFNGDNLLDGTAVLSAGGESVTIDDLHSSRIGEVEIEGRTHHLEDISSGGGLSLTSDNIGSVMQVLGEAMRQIAVTRGELGTIQNCSIRPALENLGVSIENVAAAESQIRDTDYAAESANLVRLGVLREASMVGVAMSATSSERIMALLS